MYGLSNVAVVKMFLPRRLVVLWLPVAYLSYPGDDSRVLVFPGDGRSSMALGELFISICGVLGQDYNLAVPILLQALWMAMTPYEPYHALRLPQALTSSAPSADVVFT